MFILQKSNFKLFEKWFSKAGGLKWKTLSDRQVGFVT
jgi:hypothetical protein